MSSPKLSHVLSLLALVGLAPTLAGADDESSVTVSVGASYDTGDYDDTRDTDSFSIPVSLKYERGDWIAKLSTSYLSLDGPVLPDSDDTRLSSKESGLGDVVAGLSYLIFPKNEELPLVELTTKVKLPTADDRDGLGTGKVDVSYQVDLSKTYGGFTPFGTLGYRYRRGPLDSGLYFSLGGGFRVSEKASAGLIYDFRQASVSRRTDSVTNAPISVDDSHEIVPYLNFKLSDRMSLQSYGVIGLSNNAPDYGLGTQLSVGF